MTQRERSLAGGLIAVTVVIGGLFAFNSLFLTPYRQLQSEAVSLRGDVDKKKKELETEKATAERAEKLSPRLAQWNHFSLPDAKDVRPEEVLRHLSGLQVDYERYLSDLLRRSGFVPASISVTARALETPRVGSAIKGPPPAFKPLTFTAQGQAGLEAIAAFLEAFHRGGLLQEVKSFTFAKPQSTSTNVPKGALEVTMAIEAIMVTGGERRPNLLPETSSTQPPVLATSARRYSDLAAHNIFTGTPPPIDAARKETEDPRDVLEFIKLTTVSNLNNRRWEAWIRDLAKPGGESRLRMTTGFNEFTCADRFDNTLVRGIVLRIDERGVVFRANGKFIHLGLGQSLYDALEEESEASAAAGAALGLGWASRWRTETPEELASDDAPPAPPSRVLPQGGPPQGGPPRSNGGRRGPQGP